MRKSVLAVAVALSILTPVSAFAADNTISFDALSKYAADPGIVLIDSSVEQVNLFTSYGNGFYTNLWAITEKRDQFEEVDYTVGAFGQNGKLSWDVSLSYWYLTKLVGPGFNIVVPALNVSYALSDSLSVIGMVRHMTVQDSSMSGVQEYVGLSKSFTLNDRLSLSTQAYVGYDTTFQSDTWFSRVEAIPTYKVSDSLTVRFLGVTVRKARGTSSEVIGTIAGVNWSF
jgi:hypothetical protein